MCWRYGLLNGLKWALVDDVMMVRLGRINGVDDVGKNESFYRD